MTCPEKQEIFFEWERAHLSCFDPFETIAQLNPDHLLSCRTTQSPLGDNLEQTPCKKIFNKKTPPHPLVVCPQRSSIFLTAQPKLVECLMSCFAQIFLDMSLHEYAQNDAICLLAKKKIFCPGKPSDGESHTTSLSCRIMIIWVPVIIVKCTLLFERKSWIQQKTLPHHFHTKKKIQKKKIFFLQKNTKNTTTYHTHEKQQKL